MSEGYSMRSGVEILEALDKASRGVQAASEELSALSQRFHEAHIDGEGEIFMGVGLRYKAALDEERVTIYEMAIASENRPPAADIREAMADRAVRIKHPELWTEYQADKARIDSLQSWISNLKAAISANQSIRKGEAT